MGTREISRKLDKMEKAASSNEKKVALFWIDAWEALSEEEREGIRVTFSEVMVLSWENEIDIFEGL